MKRLPEVREQVKNELLRDPSVQEKLVAERSTSADMI